MCDFDIVDPQATVEKTVDIKLPPRVKKNGTMYLGVFSTPFKMKDDPEKDWAKMIGGKEVTYNMVPLTQHQVPEAETFNLLGSQEEEAGAKASIFIFT